MPVEDSEPDLTCRWYNCMQVFNSLDELVNHLNSTHVTSQQGNYFCLWQGCARNKGFNARYKMLIHIRTHTNERPFPCPECGKKFSRQENLRIHARTHTGEKPYVCNVLGCGKAYSNSSDRFKHSRTHQTEKPYECRQPGCNKRYTDPSSLRKHVKIYNHSYKKVEEHSSVTFSPPQSISPASSGGGSSLGNSPTPLAPRTPVLHHPFFPQASSILHSGGTLEYEGIARLQQYYMSEMLYSNNNPQSGDSMNFMEKITNPMGGSYYNNNNEIKFNPNLYPEDSNVYVQNNENINVDISLNNDNDMEVSQMALDLSVDPHPLDLSLPSSRLRRHQNSL